MIGHKSKGRDSGLFWQAPEYLKAIREKLSLSQQDLAKNSGITRSIIADIESGRTYFSSLQHALSLYKTLEALGSAEARPAVLSAIALVRESAEHELFQLGNVGISTLMQQGHLKFYAIKGWTGRGRRQCERQPSERAGGGYLNDTGGSAKKCRNTSCSPMPTRMAEAWKYAVRHYESETVRCQKPAWHGLRFACDAKRTLQAARWPEHGAKDGERD